MGQHRFAIFTRTLWDEPPRLRRQVAELLLEHGHEVHFFENRQFGRRRYSKPLSAQLWLHGGGHLLHHQLKILPWLNAIDAAYIKSMIRRQFDPRPTDVVLNFCYDFYFLRDLFPHNRILHIVNDDILAAAIRPHKRSARRLLHATSRDADHNLVVSYLIRDQILEATDKVAMFFPWARHPYERPPESRARPDVLYWGYINERIDERSVMGIMDNGIRVHFVGHVTPSKLAERILGHTKASHLPPHALEDLPHVLERCCCAISPYDINNPYNPAVTMNNRGFELLSFGLPLLFNDLPNLIEAPDGVIYRCRDAAEFIASIEKARREFDAIQPAIEAFLVGHTPQRRYEQLMDLVGEVVARPT